MTRTSHKAGNDLTDLAIWSGAIIVVGVVVMSFISGLTLDAASSITDTLSNMEISND